MPRNLSSAFLLFLAVPGRFGDRIARADAAESQAFADVPGSLVEVAVDRAELAGAI